MENELLRAESGANIKAYLDYAYHKLDGIYNEIRLIQPFNPDEYDKFEEQQNYWLQVLSDCKQELESRITKIFPR